MISFVTEAMSRYKQERKNAQKIDINSTGRNLSQYITTEQAAELLGMIPTSVNHLIYSGKIRGIKIGRDWLVFKPLLEAYVRTKSTKGRPTSKTPKLRRERI